MKISKYKLNIFLKTFYSTSSQILQHLPWCVIINKLKLSLYYDCSHTCTWDIYEMMDLCVIFTFKSR